MRTYNALNVMKHLQVFVLTLFVLTLFVNCSPRIVPVTDVRVDSVYIARVQRDTIYERDSVLIYAQADTIHKEKYRYVYRDRLVTDTLWRERCDTINTIVEVEKELSKVEKLKFNIGNGFLWALPIILGLWVFYRKFIK